MQIIRSKKENCRTCQLENENGLEEPCLTCMNDKQNHSINYYTMYQRDYNKWPESQTLIARPVPKFGKE